MRKNAIGLSLLALLLSLGCCVGEGPAQTQKELKCYLCGEPETLDPRITNGVREAII